MKNKPFSSRLLAVLMAAFMLLSASPVITYTTGTQIASVSAAAEKKFSKCTITVTKVIKYTGKARKPLVTVIYGNKILTQGRDYTVKYANNVNVGVGTVTVTARKGSGFTGSKTLKFKILPAKVAGLKVSKRSTNYIQLTWDAVKGATGYVLYSYDAKTKTYTKIKSCKKPIVNATRLNAGKVYRFAVRAYTKSNGKNYYGSYSKVLKAATLAAAQPTTVVPPTNPTNPTTPVTPTNPTTPVTPTNPAEPTTPVTPPDLSDITVASLSGLKATKSGDNVILTWKKGEGEADGYQVCTYNASTGKYSPLVNVATAKATIKDLAKQTPHTFAVHAYVKRNGATKFGDYSEQATTTVYYADYYANVFASGEYTASMKIYMEDMEDLNYTVATKNGNINLKTSMKAELIEGVPETVSIEMRYLKPSGKVTEDKTYMKVKSDNLLSPVQLFAGTWLDGSSLLGNEDDLLDQAGVFSSLELDNTDSVAVSSETISGKTYNVETVTGVYTDTKLYYQNGELKRIAIVSGSEASVIDITSFSATAKDSLFTRPENAVAINF